MSKRVDRMTAMTITTTAGAGAALRGVGGG